MITSKIIHTGQYRRYGDSFTVWEINVTEGENLEVVRQYCFDNLISQNIPSYKEWNSPGCSCSYFDGYYTLDKKPEEDSVYTLSRCIPYCD